MFRSQPQTEDNERLRKLWEEYIEYVKNRDRKIKSMEELIRKKDKEINQKAKLEELIKASLHEAESLYIQNKEKMDKVSKSM